jgi:8-oxo-dGTP pyrophosphatase MutT (NUDIX family)
MSGANITGPAAAALVRRSACYLAWRQRIAASGCRIVQEQICHVVQRTVSSYYLALLDCRIETPEGEILPRCIVLRGAAVGIIPLLRCEHEWWTVLVRQRRIIDGEFSAEFPSGGVNADATPRHAALQEVHEELGLVLADDELVPLNEAPLKVCESLSDETVHWFAFQRSVDRRQLAQLDGSVAGDRGAGESIVLRVVKLEQLRDATNFQVLTGLQVLAMHRPEFWPAIPAAGVSPRETA